MFSRLACVLLLLVVATGIAVAVPTVVNVSPAQHFDVPVGETIAVKFSEPMDLSTLTYGESGRVKLCLVTPRESLATIQAQLVPMKVTFSDGSVHVIGFKLLPPGGQLANSDRYTLFIKGGPEGVKSEKGEPMAQDFYWTWHTTSWTLVNGHFAAGLGNWRAIHRPASETAPGKIVVEAVKSENTVQRIVMHFARVMRGPSDTRAVAGIEQGLGDIVCPVDVETGVVLCADVLRLQDAANSGIRVEVDILQMTSAGPVARKWGATYFPPLPTTSTAAQWMTIKTPNLIQAAGLKAGDQILGVRIFTEGTAFHFLVDHVRMGAPQTPSQTPAK